MEPTCARLGCHGEARETTLCGATRVPTCPRHVAEYLERYPEDRDLVWPVGVLTEAPPPVGFEGVRRRPATPQ